METGTLLKIADTLFTALMAGIIIGNMFKIKEMKELIDSQQGLIELQHAMLDLCGVLHNLKVIKQEKCYGSTSASKAEGQGSTPCSCATIMEELKK